MIIQKVQQFGKQLLQANVSTKKLARSVCLGIFIAFSPFIGLHTILGAFLSWLFSLNYPTTLVVQLAINNPWTMVPIYGCDYGFGRLISGLCHIDLVQSMPLGFSRLFEPVCSSVGLSSDSIWTFFVGGNVLSVLLAIGMYFPIKWLFNKFEKNVSTTTTS